MKKLMLDSFLLCTALLLLAPTLATAETSSTVETLAQTYGADPLELQAALQQKDSNGRFSPFSHIATQNDAPAPTMTVTPATARSSKVKVSRWNEDSTAYTAPRGALTASGKTPQVGMCAMNINVTTTTQNSTRDILRLGKPIYMTKPVKVQGKNYNSFVLEDRGQPTGKSRYWIDIFFGESNAWNDQQSINYGDRKVSFYYWVQ